MVDNAENIVLNSLRENYNNNEIDANDILFMEIQINILKRKIRNNNNFGKTI